MVYYYYPRLYLFCVIKVTLGSFSVGNALAWTSPSLPRISQELCNYIPDSIVTGSQSCDITGVTTDLAGWIGPLLPVGAIIVGPLIGILVDDLGRKWTMVVLAIPMFVGWILVTVSKTIDSIIAVYIGRILIGKLVCGSLIKTLCI